MGFLKQGQVGRPIPLCMFHAMQINFHINVPAENPKCLVFILRAREKRAPRISEGALFSFFLCTVRSKLFSKVPMQLSALIIVSYIKQKYCETLRHSGPGMSGVALQMHCFDVCLCHYWWLSASDCVTVWALLSFVWLAGLRSALCKTFDPVFMCLSNSSCPTASSRH